MQKVFSSLGLALFILFSSLTNHVKADANTILPIKSEAAALLDSETNAVLYTKNADVKMYPASVTKIATAIYAIENGDLNSIATVSYNAETQDGTRVYLVEGEQIALKALIQGMLVNSGNDAAVAIAEHIDGSVEQFSENINKYLKTKVGVNNTHFTNPSGLFDENHYTTAMDIALITNYAIKNPVFAEIFGTKVLQWEGASWKSTILTHHRMLKGELPYPGITGGKTGYTSEAKQTLSTTADNGKLKLTAVVLKSELKDDKYDDTALLLDYGFNNYQHSTVNKGEIFVGGGKEYTCEKDYLITEGVNGSIKKVSSTGLLTIEDTGGQIIQMVQLGEKKEVTTITKKIEKQPKAKNGQFTHLYSLFGGILLTLALIGISLRRKRLRKHSL